MKTPFKDNMPGEDWFLAFKKRHELSIKKPQSVEYCRRNAVDPFIVYEYFRTLKKILDAEHLHDRPADVWNLDETSLSFDPVKTKVVGAVNQPSSRTINGSGKENTTVLFACSASGAKAPPLIIFKGLNVWDEWHADDCCEYPGTT